MMKALFYLAVLWLLIGIGAKVHDISCRLDPTQGYCRP